MTTTFQTLTSHLLSSELLSSPLAQLPAGIVHLAGLAARALVASAWQALVLAALVALALRLRPRSGPETRYTLWAALLSVILLLPLFSLLVDASTRASSSPHGLGAVPVLHLDARWTLALSALWLGLSLVRAVTLAVGALRLRSLARAAEPVTPGHVYTTLSPANHQRTATLCTTKSDRITQPSVVGFRSPRILIPAWMYAGLTSAELNQIVLHEMEHLRRRDDWMNLAQKLALVIFPLNPVLSWVERRLCHERELACDNGVLRSTAAPKLYASCLVHLAESRLRFRQMPLALGAWARRSELAQRVDHILHTPPAPTPNRLSKALTSALFLALLGGSAVLSRSSELVSFSPLPARATPLAGITAPSSLRSFDMTARPVSLRAGDRRARPHATFLMATMPSPQDAAVVLARPRRKRVAATRRQPHMHASQQPLVRQTSWSHAPSAGRIILAANNSFARTIVGAAPSSARVILAVEEVDQFSHTYAAVPTPGGWIIFQL